MAIIPGEQFSGIGRFERFLSRKRADCYGHGGDTGTRATVMTKPSRGFPRPLAEFAGAALNDALRTQGFASAEIIARWAEIAGLDVAAHSEPIKINWPRATEGGASEPATLVLRVEGPAALEIQHSSGVILERVNRFFGWRAIGRIALRQAPLRRREPRRLPTQPDPTAAQRIAASLPQVEDEDLRLALGRLGAAVKGK
jgi:hypothetical protein